MALRNAEGSLEYMSSIYITHMVIHTYFVALVPGEQMPSSGFYRHTHGAQTQMHAKYPCRYNYLKSKSMHITCKHLKPTWKQSQWKKTLKLMGLIFLFFLFSYVLCSVSSMCQKALTIYYQRQVKYYAFEISSLKIITTIKNGIFYNTRIIVVFMFISSSESWH